MGALRQQVKVFVDANLAPAARSARLAALAIEGRDTLIKGGRASPVYRTFVDGAEGKPETAVKGTGGGTILYMFSSVGAATAFALGFLRARSPQASGRFRDSFWVGVDGRFIRPGTFSPDSVPPGAEIVIGNTQPYNRRVDVQMVGDKKLNYSVPEGLYDDCVRALLRQFNGAITAKRVYTMTFPGQYTLKQNQYRLTGRRAGQVHRSAGGKVESPAIVINPRAV